MAGKKRVPARLKVKKEYKPQGFTKREWITLGIVVGAIAVILIGYFLLRDYFDGSLRVEGGVVQAEEDWIVVNTGTSNSPKYFKLGEVSPVDGYAMTVEHLSDQNVPTFTFKPESGGAIENVEILAAKGGAQEMAERFSDSLGSFLQSAVASEASQRQIGGRTGWAFSCDYENPVSQTAEATPAPDAAAAPKVQAARMIDAYFDASRGLSIMVSITAKADDAAQLPSVEDMYAMLDPFVQGLTIDGVAQATAAP